MSGWDWERFGDDIYRSVQDAVDSGDFSRLNQTITNTVNGALDGIGRGMRDMGHTVNQGLRSSTARNRRPFEGTGGYRADFGMPPFGNTAAGQSYRYQSARRSTAGYGASQANTAGNQSYDLKLYEKTTGAKAFGIIFSVLGYTFTGIFLLAVLIVAIAAAATGDFGAGFQISIGTMLALTAVSVMFSVIGKRKLGLVKRFRGYLQVLDSREYCDIKELCAKIGKEPQYVIKDLQKMIAGGWFKQGHLDAQKTCLIVSNAAYEQYENLMRDTENRKREEAEKKARQEAAGLSPELQEIIRRGDEYVAGIRACNDAIPGEEISAKISRMEMLVDRIFDRVEQNPESVGEIRKLMDYYLPTTMKLLEAYKDLDAQPVQGDNIRSSKQEIENTLDTLNIAFEKLLDDMFQDTAWDVSSDISVLNTMLAQEGLKEEDFKQKK